MATIKQALTIAAGELGIKESPANSNNVKYNTWYYGKAVSGSAYPWCMAFVQWVFNKAGMKLPYLTASCSGLLNWYQKNRPACVTKKPQPGDIVIYNFGHTGIVESVGNGTVTAIEGNTSPGSAGSQSNGGMVCRRTRKVTVAKAYIRPDYGKEKDDLNIDKLTDVELVHLADRMQQALGKRNLSPTLAAELAEAKARGITDGSNPGSFVTRAQSAVMALRSAKNKQTNSVKENPPAAG